MMQDESSLFSAFLHIVIVDCVQNRIIISELLSSKHKAS